VTQAQTEVAAVETAAATSECVSMWWHCMFDVKAPQVYMHINLRLTLPEQHYQLVPTVIGAFCGVQVYPS